MKNRVYNKAFGKIVRTLGFLLVLASSIFLATNLILTFDTLPFIDNLLPFANMGNDFIATIPAVQALLEEYAGFALVVGFILILWAIRKGIILRVLLTVLLFLLFIESSITGTSPLYPIALQSPSWITSVLSFVEPYVNQLNAMSEYVVPGVAVGAPFLLWALFAYKKPSRLSTFLYRIASTTLFLAVLMLVVKTFVPTLDGIDLYNTAQAMLYILSYLLFAIGGVFGVLGFARK